MQALVEAAEERQKENSSVNGSNGSRSFEDFENDPIAEVFGKEKRKNYYREISSTSTMKQVCHHREVMNGERVVWVEKVFDPKAPIYEAPRNGNYKLFDIIDGGFIIWPECRVHCL